MTLGQGVLVGIGYFILGRGGLAVLDAGLRMYVGRYAMQFWTGIDSELERGAALFFWPFLVGVGLAFLIGVYVLKLVLAIAGVPLFFVGMIDDGIGELKYWWRGRERRRFDREALEAARLQQIERDADDVIAMISEGK